MSYRVRKILAAVLLLLWLPMFIVVSLTVVNQFERPSLWLELAIYVALGVLWALPFRWVFRGIGRADPDATPEDRA